MYHSTFQFTFSAPKWEMLLVLLWSTKLYNEPRTTNTITEPRWCGAINSAPSPTKWILCVLTIEAPLYCHWSETSTSSPHPRSSNYQDKAAQLQILSHVPAAQIFSSNIYLCVDISSFDNFLFLARPSFHSTAEPSPSTRPKTKPSC